MHKDQIFRQIEKKFCKLTDELKKEWGQKSEILTVGKGHILCNEGERSNKLWYIAEGTVRAYYHNDGKKICDWFAFEDQFICSPSSFYSDRPSLHHIDLLSDGILLETSRDDIGILCEKYHEYERLGRLSTTESMLGLQEKVVSLQFESAPTRLAKLLNKHPDIYQKAPLGDIASYIGITQETLSRIRAKRNPNLT